MRVCFITNEFFGLGRYGGFGKLTQIMAEYLLKNGVDVFVVSWRGAEKQERISKLNGIKILSYHYNPSNSLKYIHSHLYSYKQSLKMYREVNADVYHSIELQLSTYVSQKAMPKSKHIVWFQDPYDETAYQEMSSVDNTFTWNSMAKIRFYSNLAILRRACNKSDKLVAQAKTFIPLIERLYKPTKAVTLLLNPVEIPKTNPEKASEPTVCFLGRWDPQKRVEKFIQLAQRFPKVKFVAMGKANENLIMDTQLRRKYRKIPNLELTGFVSENEKEHILSKSWVIVNTSIREGLPISFLEALAHRTAILSYVDPDGFASRFGHHVERDTLDCLETGLTRLLENDVWKERSELGYRYVKEKHEANKVINECIHYYKDALSS